jgi:hypothetical protein
MVPQTPRKLAGAISPKKVSLEKLLAHGRGRCAAAERQSWGMDAGHWGPPPWYPRAQRPFTALRAEAQLFTLVAMPGSATCSYLVKATPGGLVRE